HEHATAHMNGKPQVMVVDDDLAMCNFLRAFLAERGYQAVTLSSAEEAVKRYHNERPAAVILDVVMPGHMDGLEALAAFKKIDREVPVIVLSGQGERMAEVRELIDRVADTDVTVLVRGESGVGKELVARALYASSLRRDRPFVKVNCAALPTELLESELFGFERGAFTGAIQHKPGKFEFA